MKRTLLSFCFVLTVLVSCSPVVDVLIVGGGASGVAAGLQSARNGAKTIIVEEYEWLGGMLTSAGVSAVDGNYNLRGGIFGEFCDSLANRYGGYEALKTGWVSNVLFEPHVGNEIFMNMAAKEKSLELRFGESFVSAEKEDGLWTVTMNRDGKNVRYRARVLVDGTELGDVAAYCGVRRRVGMDARALTGESIAPEKSNDVIQDLTYVAVLKDYGEGADVSIEMPEDYSPEPYLNCCGNPLNVVRKVQKKLWSPEEMLDYGRLPNNKFMINWPIEGNDFYVNVVEDPEAREEAFRKAKNFTLGFVYFIQHELGFKNIGIADDEFPTEDGLPFIPYHRESGRTIGEAHFTVNHAADPYGTPEKYYRTGIAVGDYPVDHHHNRHPEAEALPELHFYPIPSYNLPLGALVPLGVDNLIVAEKSVSVSNLVNGTTRLQPVVMQIGQAAGALASLAAAEDRDIREVKVRDVQRNLLESGAYLMPYLDLKPADACFGVIQRIGATGILKGKGMNVGWSNQTWFRTNDLLTWDELRDGMAEYWPGIEIPACGTENPGLSDVYEVIRTAGSDASLDEMSSCLSEHGCPSASGADVSRLQFAVLVDEFLDPFGNFDIDYSGEIVRSGISSVNTMIGSGGHGHVFVGASRPHGMIMAGPNNVSEGWDWCSGYHESDRTIAGFAQNHLSGTGIADLGEIIFMPFTGENLLEKGTGNGDGYAVSFDKGNEVSVPGYYSVYIPETGIRTEITATDKVAFYNFDFKVGGGSSKLILDLKHAPKSIPPRTGCLKAEASLDGNGILTGKRVSDEWARDHEVYFAAAFSSPVLSVSGDSLRKVLDFGPVGHLGMRVAISYASEEGARANLLESDGLDFDEVRASASVAWEDKLASIEFKGISPDIDTVFNTALYHTAMAPQLFSDQGDTYTIFSLWDTYRAVHPLYLLTDPKAPAYINSLLEISEKSDRLPVWHLAGRETDCMVGVHSVPVLADAILKDVPGVDRNRVWRELQKYMTTPAEGLEYVDSLGFLPADKVNWSVSRALEYCIDDAAMAAVALKMGDKAGYEYHLARSKQYKKYFDAETGYMRGRLSDGKWTEPFHPSYSYHEIANYVEGNAWQYTWLVPHDMEGLMELFGGREGFISNLDKLFTADPSLNAEASADITGMIGQYAHGNEPSHHIAYFYTMAGERWKTAELIRKICRDFYTTAPDGLIGNEDCGQMSSWYIFSALGFYPVCPFDGKYYFGSPLAKSAVMNLPDGGRFRIEAPNNSAENKYISAVYLNGKPYDKDYITYDDIMAGGLLEFEMTNNK